MKEVRTLLLLAVMLLTSGVVKAQGEQTLYGCVVDSLGQPIAGALVNISELSRIAISDDNGRFELKHVKPSDELIVSCLGYFNKTVKAAFVEDFKIVLTPDLDPYAHKNPVAFQTKPIKLITEARSVVSGEELQKHPITVLQNAFTATVNGVETYEWSSEPGWTESAIYIRGIRTMNTSARSPLVIVDNVERDMSFLDAFPIESITILKDAAATAIYGMRGANGVILVTTRRGEAGKTHIEFTQEVGFQKLSNKMEVQNSYNMALTRNRVKYLDGSDPLYTTEQIEKYRRVCAGETLEGIDQYKYFNTNWFKELYRESAPMYKTNFQLSGGNDRARYFLSMSYLRQEGMWNDKWTKYNAGYNTSHTLNRYNLRSNIDIDVAKFLNVSLDLGGRIDDVTQPTTAVFNLVTFGAVEANPMEPVYCPNGEIYGSSTAQNAGLLLAASGQEKNRRRSIYTTLELNSDLSSVVKGLKLNAVVSFDAYEQFESTQYNAVNSYNYDYNNDDVQDVEDFTYTKYTTYSALSDPTALQREYSYNINMRYAVNYENTFGAHGINATAFLRTYQSKDNGYWSANRYYSTDRFVSFNGIATYDYENRYIVNASISRMATDNYSEDTRWGTFWGASLGWVASEESFLDYDFIDLLKVRGSYGVAGQSDTGAGRYPYQSTYSSGTGYGFGYSASYVTGYLETLAGNSNNRWETSKMINFGLDFDLYKRKVYGSFDLFKEWRSGILVDRAAIPSYLGVSVAQDSYGRAETHGFELNIGHENKIGDFTYFADLNLTFNTNKVIDMDESAPKEDYLAQTGQRIRDFSSVVSLYESTFDNTIGGWDRYQFQEWATDESKICSSQADAQARRAAGQVSGKDYYPYHTASNGAQALGTAVFKDLNGDDLIDDSDMLPDTYTIIPELIPSLKLGVSWKGIDVGATLTAYLRRDVFLSPAVSWSGWSNMGTHEVVDSWGYYTDDPYDSRNLNAKYPRPTYSGFNAIDSDRDTGTYHNSIWIQNGNFLSLRNIELGYSLPARLIAKANMTKCRIYVQGYNLKNWSNLPDGVDPEKPMSYCWWYPKTRSYSIGLNIAF